MTTEVILDVPIFSKRSLRYRRRRLDQSFAVPSRHLFAFPAYRASDLTPVVSLDNVPVAFEAGTGLIRPLRSSRGVFFHLDELKRLERQSAADVLSHLLDERDHPYAPLLPDGIGGLQPLDWPTEAQDALEDSSFNWLTRICCVDGTIYGPAHRPCLALSLVPGRRQLHIEPYTAPAPPPSLRFPSLYLDLGIPVEVLRMIMRTLELDAMSGPHLERVHVSSRSSRELNWPLLTLFGLGEYVRMKGARNWPPTLPLKELLLANNAVRRCDDMQVSEDWMTSFLQSQPSVFGNISGYVAELQALLLARHDVLGPKLTEAEEEALSHYPL